MSRKALVVGINYYESLNRLYGCVNDAHNVKAVLERNGNGSLNFDVKLLTSDNEGQKITSRFLKDSIKSLFEGDNEISLLYFAGHGYSENTGGYILTSDASDADEGVAFSYIMSLANNSRVKNKIIILDSCQSGSLGTDRSETSESVLSEGVTILTAASCDQYAMEDNGTGLFTSLLVDALNGGSANILGHITPGSIYAHIDQSLGPWQQRPVFKTNVKEFVVLRETTPSISLEDLRMITELFPTKYFEYQLDPTYEPSSTIPNPENTKIFDILQKYNRINLVVPVDEKHMYYAAMNNKLCKLTVLGEHYWNLVKKGRI